MSKYIRLLLLLSLIFFLSNCERFVTESWQISNQSSGNIEITAFVYWNNIQDASSISPGSKINIADFTEPNFEASIVAQNKDEVDLDSLVITNSSLQQLNRDFRDFSNWEAEVVTTSRIEYVLIVTDDDFN